MAKKFKKTAFRDWLDHLAKIVIKTDDNFTCMIARPGCSGKMLPLSRNCQWVHIKSRNSNNTRWSLYNAICGCGRCHQWAHANPNEFGVWFSKHYEGRNNIINELAQQPIKTWRENDYKAIENELLIEAKRIEVDYMNMPVNYRIRLRRKLDSL